MSKVCQFCERRIWDGEADPTAEDCVSAAHFILTSAEDVISCESATIDRLRKRIAELEAQLSVNDDEFANVAARAYQHSQEDWEHLEEAARLLPLARRDWRGRQNDTELFEYVHAQHVWDKAERARQTKPKP